MNILASYPWIKEYLKTKATPEEFAREISLRGPAVEKIISSGEAFKNIVVGKVLKVDKHPNADKLSLAKVDIGKREASIVCGGSNLAEGQFVAVALPGAKVRWHGEGELVELKPTEIRGVASEGMICAANEIGLFDLFPHAEREIMVLSATKPGISVGEAIGFEEPLFDMEATTNRPDCFAIVGVAREAAASGLGIFTYQDSKLPKVKGKPSLKVSINDKKESSRYLAAVINQVKVGPSPAWLQARLTQAGLRPVNNVVDVTNYVMLELGHPLHAFDRAAVTGDLVQVRRAKNGEKLKALDGKEYTLQETDLVIANKSQVMALAGVIGGEVSGTQSGTISIVLEAAAFDPVMVRKTSRRLNVLTDAALRFEKGLSAVSAEAALARAIEVLKGIIPSAQVVELIDCYPGKKKPAVFSFSPTFAEDLIGETLPAKTMKKILEDLGFGVTAKGLKWSVTVPAWREHDIEDERDLVEEVARIYGYHNVKPELPSGALSSAIPSASLFWEGEIKRLMEDIGWTEVMTYSFTNETQYKPLERSIDGLVKIANPLSAEFTHLRDMLLPGMLQVVAENQEREPRADLFELSNVYLASKNGLPSEESRFLALSYGADDEAFSSLKGLWETVVEKFGIRGASLRRVADASIYALHPGRSAEIVIGGEVVGVLGELSPRVLRAARIERRAGMLSLIMAKLEPHLHLAKSFSGIPEFPSIKRDLSFVVADRVTHDELVKKMSSIDQRIVSVERFDEFRGKGLPEGHKSLAYHLEFREEKSTMTTESADEILNKIRETLKVSFKADLRS